MMMMMMMMMTFIYFLPSFLLVLYDLSAILGITKLAPILILNFCLNRTLFRTNKFLHTYNSHFN